MPFSQLVNAQQVQIGVLGPGDVNTLYLCKGLRRGPLPTARQHSP